MGLTWHSIQVVDERMWGDEDKPEPDQKPGKEQQGKDAPSQVSLFILFESLPFLRPRNASPHVVQRSQSQALEGSHWLLSAILKA